jgi:hypothetical protein
VVSDKLKKIIFDELYFNLSTVEIICYDKSIWFIDREKKFWYFQFVRGTLWYRYDYFHFFFKMFSLIEDDFKPILMSWVEEVINTDVVKISKNMKRVKNLEESLNYKVKSFYGVPFDMEMSVDEVTENNLGYYDEPILVGNVLKHKDDLVVNDIIGTNNVSQYLLNEVLSKWRD